MWQIVLGSFGFLLYFIYDINSIRKKNVIFQKFFAVGTVFVVVSLLMELLLLWGQCQHRIERMIGFGTGAVGFFALLIYTCFLLFPLKKRTVKIINCVLHIQKVCMVCVVILEFCGLQVHIFVCGECLADGNRGSIFCL